MSSIAGFANTMVLSSSMVSNPGGVRHELSEELALVERKERRLEGLARVRSGPFAVGHASVTERPMYIDSGHPHPFAGDDRSVRSTTGNLNWFIRGPTTVAQ